MENNTDDINDNKERLLKIKKIVSKYKIDALYLDDETTLFYILGIHLSGVFIISSESETDFLFVDGRFLEDARKKVGKNIKIVSRDKLSEFLQNMKKRQRDTSGKNELENFKNLPKDLAVGKGKNLPKDFRSGKIKNLPKDSEIARVGIDGFRMTLSSYEKLINEYKGRVKIVPIDDPLRDIKLIKDKREIAKMKRAAIFTEELFSYCKSILREGISEREVFQKLQIYLLEVGCDGPSFSPIIAFGENASSPHHVPDIKRLLKKGDWVLVDIGAKYDGYCADFTRTFKFGGNTGKILKAKDKKHLKMFTLVKEAHELAVKNSKIGVSVAKLDEMVRKFFKKHKIEEYFVHSLGHGIGLDVHEYPRLNKDGKKILLKEGMVITIEPGLYFENDVGFRYENMYLITKDGAVNFFKD